MSRRPTTSRLNRRVSSLTSRLDDFKVPLGILVALIGAFLAYVAFVSTTGPPFQSRYQVKVEVPGDAPPVRIGQAVRIGGKLAGLISDVEPDRDNGGTIVTANITKTEFRPVGEDATARVTVHSIVYATYLELYPGDTGEPMPNGGTILQERVSSGVDLLEIVELFDERTRRSLRDTVVNVGYGVAGRGEELNEAAARLRPLSVDLRRQLDAATEEAGAISRGVEGAAATVSGLEGERDDDVAAAISAGDAVLGAVATRQTELGATIRLLRPFEDRFLEVAPAADPLLAELAVTAVELEPAVRGLNAALPGVNRLLGLGDVLRTESARIARVSDPVLRTTRPLVRDIYPTVASLDPLVPDVKRIANHIRPYAEDIRLAGRGLAEATSTRYPQGRGPGAGAPMGRVIPILTCHRPRNPFPGPGEPRTDSRAC